MPSSPLGFVHFAFAILALFAGAFVCLNRKGNRRHRRTGWFYFVVMLGLNGTAFFMYRLLGHFGPFHIAAVISLITVLAGLFSAHWKKPGKWMEGHAMWMTWSYVGLWAAAVAEVSTRFFPQMFWGVVVAATLLVVGIGNVLIRRNVPRILKSFGQT